ncbi:MAG: glycosyltransferase family 2 protein [Clostridia bacterium]|nr:glycosyltransferase family 2 protein [Clostridia bacterium]
MISVIIPAYNEEKRITKTLEKIYEVMSCQNDAFEILVVSDGSTDQTNYVVESFNKQEIFLLSYEKNRGKGGAVKFGIENAKGECIAFMDADLPYPPEKITEACGMLKNGADVVLGMRVESGHDGKYPWYRKLMSKGFGFFVTLVLGLKEKDTQCGFKAFKKEAAQNIFKRMTLSGWGFDVEMIFLAEKLRYSIERIKVSLFHEKTGSKVKAFHDTFKMMKEVFSVRKNYKKGNYKLS